MVAGISQTGTCIIDDSLYRIKVSKLIFIIFLDLYSAAIQKFSQIRTNNMCLRPVQNAVIIITGKMNDFIIRYVNAMMIIKSIET